MATLHRQVAVDDVVVFYREAGEADASQLLLLHGFLSSSHMYRNLIPALAQQYHVVAPDLPGFGYTEAPARDVFAYGFETITHVVDRFVETLGLGRFVLVVFDAGAPVDFRLEIDELRFQPTLLNTDAVGDLEKAKHRAVELAGRHGRIRVPATERHSRVRPKVGPVGQVRQVGGSR